MRSSVCGKRSRFSRLRACRDSEESVAPHAVQGVSRIIERDTVAPCRPLRTRPWCSSFAIVRSSLQSSSGTRLGIALPEYTEVRTDSAELTQVAPTEYHADLVILLVDGKPVLGIIVEVQLQADPDKPFSWPVYAATLRARLRCPACVLVVTPSASVARWARAPIETGPGAHFEALVVGPDAVPAVRDVDSARREPELAVLSAMAHGGDSDANRAAEIALAALMACLDLDTERAAFYADVVRTALGDAARAALETLMQSPERREFQSEFARKYVAVGRAEGEAKGEARALLAVLEARGLAVSTETRDHIVGCTDIAVLENWIRRAVTVASVEDLFTDSK